MWTRSVPSLSLSLLCSVLISISRINRHGVNTRQMTGVRAHTAKWALPMRIVECVSIDEAPITTIVWLKNARPRFCLTFDALGCQFYFFVYVHSDEQTSFACGIVQRSRPLSLCAISSCLRRVIEFRSVDCSSSTFLMIEPMAEDIIIYEQAKWHRNEHASGWYIYYFRGNK